MSLRLLTAAALLAAPIAAAPAIAQAPATMATPSTTMFLKKAAASDKFEINSARLMVKSSNPQIRQFAQRMITDHTKSTAMIAAAARQANMTVPAAVLNSTQATDIEKLNAVNGSTRDNLYITQQKKAHAEALALMQSYAANGTSAPLRQTAGQIAPVVQSHIDMLNQMPAA